MSERALNEKSVLDVLNRILEIELAGVVRYTHYSLMVFGHARIPIVSWMRTQANEGLTHAVQAGEHITAMGGQILREAMEHEQEGVDTYRKLLELVRDKDVMLEEYARRMVHDEEVHISEIEKMLRRPGKLEPAR